MTGFRYLPPAEEEMTEAAIFYEEQSQGLGAEFLDDVQRTIDRLQDNPMIGQTVVDDLRRGLLARFPFSLLYAIEPGGLLVVAVTHQRRQPEYWKDRIDW